MEVNFINTMFINFTILIVVVGVLINAAEPYLPALITQSFRYGKHSHKGQENHLVGLLEVPKGWFKHFYIFAFGWSLFALFVTLKSMVMQTEPPAIVLDFLDLLAGGGKDRPALVDSTSALVAIVLITLQCGRRFYETNFVQIFSTHSKMNLSHYMVGYLHYFGAILAILANSECFVRGLPSFTFSFKRITLLQYICCFMFHFSWSQQYKSNMILVNLRKDPTGKNVTEKHLMPQGGFFNFISSPHMLFEILMYVAILGVIPNCTTWRYVVLWVIANQTENAWLTHQWYKQTFKNYPVGRKAIIPFIL